MQHAGLHTQRPLLLFLTSNITLDPPEQAPANSSYPVNRPVYFIGLISSKTSIDFRRTPNQLNLTGSGLGRVYFLSVALENQGYGDAYTTWYSGLYSPLILHNMWGVLVDRCGLAATRQAHVGCMQQEDDERLLCPAAACCWPVRQQRLRRSPWQAV
jgi:hypothetical protein